MKTLEGFHYEQVIDSICNLNWNEITVDEVMDVAAIYYYFSIQFRENLQVARGLYPRDEKLAELEFGECNTDNLSPWPGIADVGEKLDHDEFMRRLLKMLPIGHDRRRELDAVGQSYLTVIRRLSPQARAQSIASYEDHGLEKVFTAILTARHWDEVGLRAFKHFLIEHLRFDLDPELGHGALARHLQANDDVLPFWMEFRRILVEAVPRLLS